MSSLSDKQWEFLQALARLIEFARVCGYKLTMGRGFVSPAANAADGGHPKSTHLSALAMDLNLFVDVNLDGVPDYIRGDHSAWTVLGAFWKDQHDLARWGGDFPKKDYNHFSFEHEGVK